MNTDLTTETTQTAGRAATRFVARHRNAIVTSISLAGALALTACGSSSGTTTSPTDSDPTDVTIGSEGDIIADPIEAFDHGDEVESYRETAHHAAGANDAETDVDTTENTREDTDGGLDAGSVTDAATSVAAPMCPTYTEDLEYPVGACSTGAIVGDFQQLVNSHGTPLDVDSDFGPDTLDLVLSFQDDLGLALTGEIDSALIAAMGGIPTDTTAHAGEFEEDQVDEEDVEWMLNEAAEEDTVVDDERGPHGPTQWEFCVAKRHGLGLGIEYGAAWFEICSLMDVILHDNAIVDEAQQAVMAAQDSECGRLTGGFDLDDTIAADWVDICSNYGIALDSPHTDLDDDVAFAAGLTEAEKCTLKMAGQSAGFDVGDDRFTSAEWTSFCQRNGYTAAPAGGPVEQSNRDYCELLRDDVSIELTDEWIEVCEDLDIRLTSGD